MAEQISLEALAQRKEYAGRAGGTAGGARLR